MRTRVDLVSSMHDWLLCGIIVVVATVGKFGGTLLAARLTGMSLRQAAGLGILMNTRGLMELIVLNIGLDLGVISPTLFTMMVLMALVTTIADTNSGTARSGRVSYNRLSWITFRWHRPRGLPRSHGKRGQVWDGSFSWPERCWPGAHTVRCSIKARRSWGTR
jgi:Kef-type K+ transport system membrane component KefB